jgi:hypothetical protein
MLLLFKPSRPQVPPRRRRLPQPGAGGPLAGMLYTSATVGFPSGSASSELVLPGTPNVGDLAVVTVGMWSASVPGFTNQGMTPSSAMLSDNNGGSAGSYGDTFILQATEPRADAGGNMNTGGIAVFSREITSVSNPYTFTFDPDPGGSGLAWWTWAAYSIPGVVGVNATSKAWRPNPSFPGVPVALVPLGAGVTPTTTRTLALYHGHNGFHDFELTVLDPPGYTVVMHHEENSNGWAGHGGFKLKDGDTTSEAPTMPITINEGTTGAPYSSGVMVLFALDGGVDVTPYTPPARRYMQATSREPRLSGW